ncbi:MAG TPA: hypothetical protein PLN85_02615 [archaeon]|mgnify:CR=1 FL=1|nr:hypothetical protein [archaeon]
MLANKLRPKNLDEIYGQTKIVKILKEYIKNDNLPNVLFFTGNSGCGKNTFANIVAMTYSCDNPSTKDGVRTPCGVCDSCLDIIEERFQKNVYTYNGSDITADTIREIEKNIQYSTLDGKPKFIIINEAQLVRELKRLLEIIETNKKDIYFIFTSTDRSKFSSTAGKDNKSQETQALRSRGAFFNILAFNTNDIADYLFHLLEQFDPDEKIPDIFLEEGILTIAENSHGNMRQAINDFSQCLSGEIYDKKSICELLGYEDEKEYLEILYLLVSKNTQFFNKINTIQDIQSFFNYSWTVLNSVNIKLITGEIFSEQTREKYAQAIIKTNNCKKLLQYFEKIQFSTGMYFNDKLFFSYIVEFFNETNRLSEQSSIGTEIQKPVKKIKGVPYGNH